MIQDIDYAILDFIQEHLTSPLMNDIMSFITKLGDDGMIWVIICALLLISRKTRYIGFIALISLLFSLLIGNMFLKNIIARPRPFVNNDLISIIIPEPESFSFPSGHTMSSFAAAFVFARYFKKPYAILAFTLAALIAFSRIYLYVHYPSDVIVGILVGYLFSVMAIALFNQYKIRQERRISQ